MKLGDQYFNGHLYLNNDFIGIKRPLILGTEHLKPINLLIMAINKKIIRVFDIVHHLYTHVKVS